jgi:hypothetical protein
MPSPPQPRGGRTALAGRRFRCGRVGFLEATSLGRGTTHARFGGEVEQIVSNLVALSPAERSSSHSGGRAGWRRPMRREVSGIQRFESSFPSQPPRSLSGGFPHSTKRRHFRRLAVKSLVSGENVGRLSPKALESRGVSLLAEFSISEICVRERPETGFVSTETGSNPPIPGCRA